MGVFDLLSGGAGGLSANSTATASGRTGDIARGNGPTVGGVTLNRGLSTTAIVVIAVVAIAALAYFGRRRR